MGKGKKITLIVVGSVTLVLVIVGIVIWSIYSAYDDAFDGYNDVMDDYMDEYNDAMDDYQDAMDDLNNYDYNY